MKICPRCRRRYPNSQGSCTDDGARLFPLWYSWFRVWHFGLGLIAIGLAFGYFAVVEPVMEAKTHDVRTIHIFPQLVIVAPLMMALGVPFLFGPSRLSGWNVRRMKTAMIIAVSSGVCLCVILLVVLDRLGYPLG